MLHINGNEIQLTRGDTAYLQVPINMQLSDGTTSEYEIKPDDTLTLTVKQNVKDAEPCFQISLTGANTFHIEPEHTAHCNFSKYTYDVQLTTAAGDVYTVIEPTCFMILPEVTC